MSNSKEPLPKSSTIAPLNHLNPQKRVKVNSKKLSKPTKNHLLKLSPNKYLVSKR